MYAILQQGGHQYRVSAGDRLVVDRVEAEVGSVVALSPVLLVQGDDGDATVGSPTVDGFRIAATVVAHRRGPKLRVFKYKPKKRYRRTIGHRSDLTELRVEAVLAAGDPLPEPAAAAEKPRPSRRTRRSEPVASVANAMAPAVEPEEVETPEAAEVEAAEPETEAPAPPRRRSRTRAAAPAEAADAEPEAPAGDAGDPPAGESEAGASGDQPAGDPGEEA